VWIAPGDFHMTVTRNAGGPRLMLNQGPPENSCRPAADVLFRSAAAAYGAGVLAVVLTGMGQDGLRGCESVAEAGGQVVAQDEATSVVWGMPGFVARAGLADRVLPLPAIAHEVVRRVHATRPRAGERT
jgi:two-component system, chemotaxis family, protein-glutamate methylesterase/glutaminase